MFNNSRAGGAELPVTLSNGTQQYVQGGGGFRKQSSELKAAKSGVDPCICKNLYLQYVQ